MQGGITRSEILKSRITQKVLFNITVFVSSGLLMVLEIVAGRLLAPYVGMSLYTWTSVIGVVLAGLSLGNWTGGALADKGHGHNTVGIVLAGASVAALAILPLLVLTGSLLQQLQLSLLSASFFSVSLVFFIPAVLLGVLSPLIASLYLQVDDRKGRVLGRVHALSALGGHSGYIFDWLSTGAVARHQSYRADRGVAVAASCSAISIPG